MYDKKAGRQKYLQQPVTLRYDAFTMSRIAASLLKFVLMHDKIALHWSLETRITNDVYKTMCYWTRLKGEDKL